MMEERVYVEEIVETVEYDYYVERPDDLRKLTDMVDWQVVEGEPDVRGWAIVNQNGDRMSTVDDLMVSEEAGAAVMALVSLDDKSRTLVPIDWLELDAEREQALLLGTDEDLKEAPKYGEELCDFGRYYDYWEQRETDLLAEEEEQAMLAIDVTGWKLVDSHGHEIGEISDLMSDDRSGLAVVSYGAYWKMDERLTLIPLDLLEADEDTQLVHLDMTADHLQAAPSTPRAPKTSTCTTTTGRAAGSLHDALGAGAHPRPYPLIDASAAERSGAAEAPGLPRHPST